MPLGILATNTVLHTCDNTNVACDFGNLEFDPTTRFATSYEVSAFLVSPDGSKYPYGLGPIIPVRTVAFGSIPVEVDLQVQQSRDSDNLPIPLVTTLLDQVVPSSERPGEQDQILSAAHLVGKVSLRVAGLRVDGVDLGVGPACVTSETDLDVSSKEARVKGEDTYEYNPRESAYGTSGGGFNGVIDVPAFAGCTTASGDDISPILTSALSGSGNPVSVQYGATFCYGAGFRDDGSPNPASPGLDTPDKAGCVQFQFDPERHPDFWAIPLPWDIPTYAPGEQPAP